MTSLVGLYHGAIIILSFSEYLENGKSQRYITV